MELAIKTNKLNNFQYSPQHPPPPTKKKKKEDKRQAKEDRLKSKGIPALHNYLSISSTLPYRPVQALLFIFMLVHSCTPWYLGTKSGGWPQGMKDISSEGKSVWDKATNDRKASLFHDLIQGGCLDKILGFTGRGWVCLIKHNVWGSCTLERWQL